MAMSLWTHLRQPLQAFFRSWGNPLNSPTVPFDTRGDRYRYLWGFYDGTAFDDFLSWSEYRRYHALYRDIRLLWDHVHGLVEFYATHVWSGTIPEDGFTLPDGVENAIPFDEHTDEALAAAAAQLMAWWNWQERMVSLVRYTAALGELLVELVEDPVRQRVDAEFVWPGYVKAVELDLAGNVRAYSIEYWTQDPIPETLEAAQDDQTAKVPMPYQYRREVDADETRIFKDDRLVERFPNPYGFVPACWFRHHPILGARGEPAIWSTMGELDAVNGLFSHLVDRTHQHLASPIVLTGNLTPGAVRRAVGDLAGAAKRAFTELLPNQGRSEGENLNILEGPAGTEVKTVDIKVGESMEVLKLLIAGIERKCPEVTMYEELRGMTQLTGPAAARLLGDVEKRVRTVSAGYDRQMVKLLQMGIAVSGERVNEGFWESDDQRAKFATFGLDSWVEGKLHLIIMPRELVPLTVTERFEMLEIKRRVLPSLPEYVVAKEAGYNEAQFKTWIAEAEAKAKAEAEQEMNAQVAIRQAAPANASAVPSNGR